MVHTGLYIHIHIHMHMAAASGDPVTEPSFGRIYFVRVSVQKTISSINGHFELNSSTHSSNASSASSGGKRKKDHPKPRPCLCWDVEAEYCTFLIMTSFDGKNPAGESNDPDFVFMNMPSRLLLKYLISVDPTLPTPTRRSITMNRSPNRNPPRHPYNMYLILMPVKVKIDPSWGLPVEDFISNDDLRYISHSLIELEKERKEKMILNLSTQSMNLFSPESGIPSRRHLETNSLKKGQIKSIEDTLSISSQTSDDSDIFSEYYAKRNLVIQWLKNDFNVNEDLANCEWLSWLKICSMNIRWLFVW